MTVTALNTQIVGQPLTLTCNAVIVRGITSNVDIVWTRGSVMFMGNNSLLIMMDSSLVYTSTYTIPLLSTDDEGRFYYCEAVINANSVVSAIGNVSLNVISKYTCAT